MKKRARYTNFNFLLLLENYQQQSYLWNVMCRGKNWANEVWEKRYLFCGLLPANFSLSQVGLTIRQ